MPRRALSRAGLALAGTALAAAGPETPPDDAPSRVRGLIPEFEGYVQSGMSAFGVPGAAVAIVSGDRTVYSKGFGVRSKAGTDPVTPDTLFQAGSTTKAFLATVLAIAVDRGKLRWNDRVVDLYPDFALRDPYVTREFRIFDLLAQRSGLTLYANDFLVMFGYDPDWLAHSLRYARPITSFRSSFAYTNITHIIAGRTVAKALDTPDWPTLVTREIMQKLGMTGTSFTAEAMTAAPDHATGHRWTEQGSVPAPFHAEFPYSFGPAGDINTSVTEYARWLRLLLGKGEFGGQRLVSVENLGVTHTPKVAMSELSSYAMGWVVSMTANGRVIWHNGGTEGFGAHVGYLPDHDVGIVILSNQENRGFPDAVALWFYDRVLNNPPSDPVAKMLPGVRKAAEQEAKRYVRPASPSSAPDLAGLAGEYRSRVFGPTTVTVQNPGLILTLSETGARVRLDPFDGAVFTATLIGERRFADIAAASGGGPLGFVNFQATKGGTLNRMQLTAEDQTFSFIKD